MAEHASVSLATASLALRNSPKIAPETRQRVWRSTSRLGYSANQRLTGRLLTRSEPKPKLQNFGFVLLGADANHRIYRPTFHAAALEATRDGQHLFCYPILNPATDIEPLLHLNSSEADGFLLMGDVEERSFDVVTQVGRPVLVIGDHNILKPVNNVSFRDDEAGRDAVRYLHSLGHRRIAFGSEGLSFRHRQEWLSGYREAMHTLELPIGDGWIQTRWQSTPHLEVVKPLLEMRPRPTAILVTSQGEGLDLIAHCRSIGLRVPQDISVMIFGMLDQDRPPVTCMEADSGDLGRIALKRLRELVANPHEIPLMTLLDLTLHEAGTCAAPSAQSKEK